MANQRRGRQHQRLLNSDPTQGDVIPNISQNLMKKRTNIDHKSAQRHEKQPHNWKLISDLQQIPDNLPRG